MTDAGAHGANARLPAVGQARHPLTFESDSDTDMSTLRPPEPAKLVIGSFMRHRSDFASLFTMLESQFGVPDVLSAWWPFDQTEYYVAPITSRIGPL